MPAAFLFSLSVASLIFYAKVHVSQYVETFEACNEAQLKLFYPLGTHLEATHIFSGA